MSSPVKRCPLLNSPCIEHNCHFAHIHTENFCYCMIKFFIIGQEAVHDHTKCPGQPL
jgi:hypothetical protein